MADHYDGEFGSIRSTMEDVKALLASPAWKDIQAQIEDYAVTLRDAYDDCPGLEDLRTYQGQRRAIAFILDLPNILIGAIRAKSGEVEEDMKGIDDE